MRQMSKPRLANQSGIDASGSPGICRSKPCEPMDEPWTSRIVAFAGPETERFSAMNSFLPFDWVQCSWPGTERVVMVAVMKSPRSVVRSGLPRSGPCISSTSIGLQSPGSQALNEQRMAACPAPDPRPKRPALPMPAGACDCHAHVFDGARFAYQANRGYTPP